MNFYESCDLTKKYIECKYMYYDDLKLTLIWREGREERDLQIEP